MSRFNHMIHQHKFKSHTKAYLCNVLGLHMSSIYVEGEGSSLSPSNHTEGHDHHMQSLHNATRVLAKFSCLKSIFHIYMGWVTWPLHLTKEQLMCRNMESPYFFRYYKYQLLPKFKWVLQLTTSYAQSKLIQTQTPQHGVVNVTSQLHCTQTYLNHNHAPWLSLVTRFKFTNELSLRPRVNRLSFNPPFGWCHLFLISISNQIHGNTII